MNRVILTMAFVVTLFSSFVAFGLPGGDVSGTKHGHKGRDNFDAESQMEFMSGYLNLTEDQKAKIKPLLETEAKKLHTLEMDQSPALEKKLAKRKQIYDDAAVQIRQLLDADQQKKFDAMPAKHEAATQRQLTRLSAIRSPKSLWAERNLSYLSEQLSLTDEQKTKTEAILQKQAKKLTDYDYLSPIAQYRQNQLHGTRATYARNEDERELLEAMREADAHFQPGPDLERLKIWREALKKIRPLLSTDQQGNLHELLSEPNRKRKPNAHGK